VNWSTPIREQTPYRSDWLVVMKEDVLEQVVDDYLQHKGFFTVNSTFEVDGMIAEGDMVFALVRLTGVHQAEFMGVPSSGPAINVGVADYFPFENVKTLEHWGVMDTGALMQQLTGATA